MGTNYNEENSRWKSLGGKNHNEGSKTLQHRVCETSIVRDLQSLLGKVQHNLSGTAVRRGQHRDLQRLPLI